MSALPKLKLVSETEGRRIEADRRQAAQVELANPHPASVTLAHFVQRDLGVDILAGRCIVTHKHPVSGISLKVVTVREVKGGGFDVCTKDGHVWRTFKGTLAVEWLPEIRSIFVDGRDLAVGDVIDTSYPGCVWHQQIEAISHTELIPRYGFCRWAHVRNLQTGELEPLVLGNFHLKGFEVIGGAKLEAAQQDEQLVTLTASGHWRWIGQR